MISLFLSIAVQTVGRAALVGKAQDPHIVLQLGVLHETLEPHVLKNW